MQIFNCVQGDPEWFECRRGLPTASMFKAILAKGEGKTRRSYMCRLAAEVITGEPIETYKSGDMERGNVMESEARAWYAFQYNVEPEIVGFIRNGQKGCSPDNLIGPNGMLEIKTARGDLLVEKLLSGEFSPEHKAQCQGALWVAEREWIDLLTYWPRLPPLVVRAYRDELYIAALSKAVDDFNAELAELVEQVQRIGNAPRAAA